jgi:hypothetical protein
MWHKVAVDLTTVAVKRNEKLVTVQKALDSPRDALWVIERIKEAMA